MNYYDILLAKKLNGGGGGEATLIDKSISSNGTYNASSDNADGYKKVVVNVPNPSTGTIPITQNGTVDVTNYASADVNVSGWTTDGIANMSQPNGSITISSSVTSIGERAFARRTGITSVTIEGDPYFGNYAFSGCTGITTFNAPNLQYFKASYYNVASYTFSGCSGLTTLVFPSLKSGSDTSQYIFQNCTGLVTVDFKSLGKTGSNAFTGCSALRTLIIRRTDNIATNLGTSVNGFGGIYSNPNDSTIYVPQSLLSAYQSASNWVTLYNLNNNIFKKIEGSIYETQYADGTPIGA